MSVPTQAILITSGRNRKVRILGYLGNDMFRVLDAADTVRLVPRARLIMLP